MNTEQSKTPALKQKLIREMRELLAIFLYLALFFCTFATYRRLVLREMGIGYFHYGAALIKALVLAKVVLLGQHVRFAKIFNDRPLIVPTLYKVILFSLFALIFDIIEHIIGSLIHHDGIAHAFTEILSVGWVELLTRAMVMLFAFLPFFAFTETARVLGEGRLGDLFLRTGSLSKQPE